MIEESSLRNAESLIRFGTEKLSSISDVPRLEAEVLLSNLLKINPIKFHTEDIGISPNVMDKFESMIESRFKGIPIAYLIGKKEFWSLSFEINSSVLVPRPETELLIENAIELLKDQESPKILELGTGSGIVSIVLHKELLSPEITATDISSEALYVAKNNAHKYRITDINFLVSDWFSEFKNERYDLIISNPPYVDKTKLSNEELFSIGMEPDIALYSENDGTSDLEFIIRNSSMFLEHGGWLMLEHGYDQADYCMREMRTAGYSKIKKSKDIQDIPRTISGTFLNE
tara:strand:+ start:465 stop:1328 length:864 start_codon:yes stop_codon:yes gene_type:complete